MTTTNEFKKWKEDNNFIIIPSIIGFSDNEFRLKIKEEIQYLGMSIDELSKASYCNEKRMQRLVFGTQKFTSKEIKEISRVLSF